MSAKSALVSRRAVLSAGLALPLAGRAAATATASTRIAAAASFYVSSAGDDSATGRSPDTPWQSPARVDTALTDGTITRGDSVLFHRGETFFGALNAIPDADPAAAPLVFGAYGDGDRRPRLTAYKLANDLAGWSRVDTSVWRIDLTARSGAFTGNIDSPSVNVGFLKVGGVIWPAKKWALAELAADGDFYSDNEQYLYVYRSDNPAAGGDVQLAVDGNLITCPSAVAVRGLELRGTGGHGFRAPNVQRNIELSDCVIAEIGGAQLLYDGGPPTTRYGNGVELWIGTSDTTISGNDISGTYDVGVTYQGAQVGSTQRGWSNVHTCGNTIHDCTQSFEMWSDGSDAGVGSGFVDCSFSDNICQRSGYSWSAAVRPDREGKGTHLLFYDTQLPTDLQITGNTFDDAAQNYTYLAHTDPPSGLVVDHNRIELKAGTKLQYQRAQTIEQHQQWTDQTGLDQHSTFTVHS